MRLSRLLIGASLGVALSSTAFTAALADVKFGSLYPISGSLALLGEESARGLELAVDEVNAAGGIKGEKVVLERGDAVDNNQATGEARRLISLVGVKAIFGTYSSARVIAASQVSELAGIPYFEMGAVADEVTGRGLQYLFRTNPTAENMAKDSVDMLIKGIAPGLGKDPKDMKIGIIYEDSSYGTSVAGHQEDNAKAAGLTVVLKSGYPSNTVDMSSLVLELREKGADVVMQTSYQNDSVLFLQQANEAGYKPLAIIGGGGGYSMQPTADAVGHDLIDGVFDADYTQYAVNTSATPGLTEFVEAYKAKYGSQPRSGHSLTNYVGAKAIFQALNAGEGFEPDQIVSAVKALDIPDGQTAAGYGVKFGKNNQNKRATMMGMQWQDGKLVTVYPENAAIAKMRFKKWSCVGGRPLCCPARGADMTTFLQILLNGLMLGGLFAIVAVGLTLIFGIVKVVNFAHGEFLMAGMFVTWLITTKLGLHPYAAVIIVLPAMFILGALTQRLLIQPLMASDDGHAQIFATVGLSTAMINLALLIIGADIANTPNFGLRTPIEIGPLRVLTGQVFIFLGAIVLVVALQLFLKNSQTGRAIRAVAQHRSAAELMGVNVSRIYILCFGLGAACVGLAAVLIAPLYPTSSNIGTYFVLTAFVVVVLGGLGSIPGAFVGALIIGVIDTISGYYIGSDLREAVVFGIFLLILILKPSGLFGKQLNLSHLS